MLDVEKGNQKRTTNFDRASASTARGTEVAAALQRRSSSQHVQGGQRKRASEQLSDTCLDLCVNLLPFPREFAPIAFAVFTILTLWAIYNFFHCARLLQLGSWQRTGPIDESARRRGWIQLVVFNYFSIMLVISYARCILVHPGTIPDSYKDVPLGTQQNVEMKKTGLRRFCKHCKKNKPDRSHHCRQCRMCILKMDHHCPWIYNCVGFGNYKFFVVLLVYSVLACIQVHVTMVLDSPDIFDPATPFFTLLFTLFGEILAGFLALLLGAFLGFHIWLIVNAMTTIEFVEKYQSNAGTSSRQASWDPHIYTRGFYGNIKAVLGDNVFLWFLPCSRPSGNGLSFLPEREVCPPPGRESRPRPSDKISCGSGLMKFLCGGSGRMSGLAGKRKEDRRQAPD